jgi:hypothetical protein
MVLMCRRLSGGSGGTESISSHPSPRALGAGGCAAPRRVTRLISSALIVIRAYGLGGGRLVITSSTSAAYLLSSCEMT